MKRPLQGRIGIAVALLSALVMACDSGTADSAASTSLQPAATTETTMAVSPQDLLDRFADLWLAGDWAGMAAVAEPSAISTAENIGPTDLADVVWIPGCELDSAGVGSCELLVNPAGSAGSALIFSARYAVGADGGLLIVDLVPGGDAG